MGYGEHFPTLHGAVESVPVVSIAGVLAVGSGANKGAFAQLAPKRHLSRIQYLHNDRTTGLKFLALNLVSIFLKAISKFFGMLTK